MRAPLLLVCGLSLGCSARAPVGFDLDGGVTADVALAGDAVMATDVARPTDVPRVTDVPAPQDVVRVTDVPSAPPGDPATRTPEEVCGRWRADSNAARAAAGWVQGADRCDPGTLPDGTRASAVTALNLFRWLAGLGPVQGDPARHAASQACAVMLQRNGMLSHTPPMTWTCWSSLAYEGTSRGNLIGGSAALTAWTSVERLIDDRADATRTLGHRRWMLYPLLGNVGYGQATSFACLYVLGGFQGARARPWVAWPNAGPFPAEVLPPSWSISAPSLGWRDGVSRVTVTRDGAPVPVTAVRRAPNYGDDTVSWDVPNAVAGAVYAVEVSGTALGDVRYEVRPVDCR